MIIGREEIYDVAAFRAGLDAAVRGVVRVKIDSERFGSAGSVATGWLIADALVVVPDFVVPDDSTAASFSCGHGADTIPAEVVIGGVEGGDGSRTALLRLASPLEGQALPLATEATEEHQQVFIVQHPGGTWEPHLSVGRLLASDAPWLRYDADTRGGASGAPVLNAAFAVVGMHARAGSQRDTAMYNEGLTLAEILAQLRDTPAWEEIAQQHKLADVTAIRTALEEPVLKAATARRDTELVGAAVRWSFDPETFPAGVVDRLRTIVAEPSAQRWTLPAGERVSLLESAGTLDALREARGSEPASDPGQQVIDRILRGPPYSLADVPEDALPYWLQATRWFAGVAPSLPTPADVNRTLERRRMRSRLEEIGGAGFRGRAGELEQLREWHADSAAGPMVVTGIGGVGKSALVARFALELPEESLQLWLDFDRPDVAPDDAVSVLGLLFDQMATQLDGFRAPPLESSSWEAAVSALGAMISPRMKAAPAALLVLDGFEVAQHVRRHREIWRVLEQLLPHVPGLHVLVSGRAPIADLELGSRAPHAIHLEGLADEDAAQWLRDGGIENERVIARVVEITRGVPLALRLAVRWAETGGEVEELPEELPARLVDGFLYQRILDRVMDTLLKPVARDALVLRRLTADMIPAVFSDSTPEGLDADDVFGRLSQELALVGDGSEGRVLEGPAVALPGAGVLRLRPEVRSATLRLLETDDDERVRTIDQRAAEWYAGQDLDDVTNAAELVYHRLRLGDVHGAELAWREGCAPLLMYADEELPEDAEAARTWLRGRTAVGPPESHHLTTWERDALGRIRALLGRGVLDSVGPVLAERAERSSASPLVLYDAWQRWTGGDLPGARQILDAAPHADGPIGRDRAVLAARLAAEAGDRRAAERQLEAIADRSRWEERPEPEVHALTVEAARVRLTIDLQAELELADAFNDAPGRLSADNVALPSSDLVMPYLADVLGVAGMLESTGEALRIPPDGDALKEFALELDRARGVNGPSLVLPVADAEHRADMDAWRGSELAQATPPVGSASEDNPWGDLALDVAVLGRRRWRLAATSLFLAQACEQALRPDLVGEPMRLSIVGTLAAFATHERGSFTLLHERAGPLTELVDRVVLKRAPTPAPRPTELQIALTARVLRLHGAAAQAESIEASATQSASEFTLAVLRSFGPVGWPLRNLAFHLLTPDPLDMLVRRVVGIPDTLSP